MQDSLSILSNKKGKILEGYRQSSHTNSNLSFLNLDNFFTFCFGRIKLFFFIINTKIQ